MSIKPPKSHPNAIPSPKGWVSAKTGNRVKTQDITAEQIEQFYADKLAKPVQLNEALPNNSAVEQWHEHDVEAADHQSGESGLFSKIKRTFSGS